MDAADLEEFERSLAAVAGRHDGAALDVALADLGWREALADDPRAAISAWFELQGRTTVTSSALGVVVADALGLDVSTGSAVVLPTLGTSTAPGVLDRNDLRIDGLATSAFADATTATLVATAGGAHVTVSVPTVELDVRPIEGLDPWLGLVEVRGAVALAEPGEPVATWPVAVDRARLAVSRELVGCSRTMLDLACEHARTRIQFGQPIGRFQAVRHRLADALVAIESAEAVLDAAWLDGSPETSAMAKAVAGRSARLVARHAQQVLAGIGFTTEHPLHRSVRRILVLDDLFGSSRALTRAQGEQMLATRQAPSPAPL